MKILQINNCHYRRGGADVVYLNTGELLERHGQKVFYFSQKNIKNLACITSKYFVDSVEFFENSPLKKILSFPRFLYSTEAARKLENLIFEYKPDVAHIHTYKGILTPSILKTLKKNKIPVVITLHDYGFLCPHNSFLDGKGRICTKCFQKNNPLYCIINKCNRDNLIMSSVSSFEYIFHRFFFPFKNYFSHLISVCKFNYDLHFSIPEFRNKLSQVYNFSPHLNDIKPINAKGKYFLYYGRLSNEKGILTLLQAWLALGDSFILKIAGEGELINRILSFIDEHKLINIEYVGFKQKEELFEIIRNSSFVIVPSEWYENNPLSIIEAYSFGKPVIASNIGGIPEIVDNLKTGFLFNMGDSSQLSIIIGKAAVISDEEYSLLSNNARVFFEEHFSEESHYSSLMNIYENLL